MKESSNSFLTQLGCIVGEDVDTDLILHHIYESFSEAGDKENDVLLNFLCESGFVEGSGINIQKLLSREEEDIAFPSFYFDPREFLSFILSFRECLSMNRLYYFCRLLRLSFHQLCIDMFRRKCTDSRSNCVSSATREVLKVWCHDVIEVLHCVVFPTLMNNCKNVQYDMNDLFFRALQELELLLVDINYTGCCSIPYIAVELSAFFPRRSNRQSEWIQRALDLVMMFFPKDRDIVSVLLETVGNFTTNSAVYDDYSNLPLCTSQEKNDLMDALKENIKEQSIWHKDQSDYEYPTEFNLGSYFSLGIISIFNYLFTSNGIPSYFNNICAFYTLLPSLIDCLDISSPFLSESTTCLSSLLSRIPKNSIRFSIGPPLLNTESQLSTFSNGIISKQSLLLTILQKMLEVSVYSTESECRSSSRFLIETFLQCCKLKGRITLHFLLIVHNPNVSVAQHFIKEILNVWKTYDSGCNKRSFFFESVFPQLMIETVSTCLDKIITCFDFDFVDVLIRLLNFFAVFIASDRCLKSPRCCYTKDGLINPEYSDKSRMCGWHVRVLQLLPILGKCEEVLVLLSSDQTKALDHFSLESIIEHVKRFF